MWLEYRFTTPGFSCGTIPAPALYGVFGRHSRRNQLGMSVETDKGIGWLLDKSKSATLKGRFSRRRCISDASRGVEAKLSRGRGTFARVLTSRSILLESDVLLVIQTDARILAYVWIMIGVCHCRTFDSNARFMSDLIRLPADYRQLLESLKGRIRAAQLRAGVAVSRELVLLYWHIGREILDRQSRRKWGAKIIDRLSKDLKRSFPEMHGFSPRNLKYMRSFAEAWPTEQFVQQAAAQIP